MPIKHARGSAKNEVRLVRRPGASPLVFGKFLMGTTAFVTLEDIAHYLPSYEESVIEVEMDGALGKAYQHVEDDITEGDEREPRQPEPHEPDDAPAASLSGSSL